MRFFCLYVRLALYLFCFFLSSAQVTVAGLSTAHRHTHMGVSVAASSAVHVQDARVQRLLVVQRKGHGVQTTSPILPTRLLQHSVQHLETRTRFEEFAYSLSTPHLRQWSGAESVLLSRSDTPGASRLAPSPFRSAPGKKWRNVAGQYYPCRSTCPWRGKKMTSKYD